MNANYVSGPLAVVPVLKLASCNGVIVGELLAGLPFDERTIQETKYVDWDSYCTVLERLAAAVGGIEQFKAMVTLSYHGVIPPEFQAMFAGFVSPAELFRFVYSVAVRFAYPGVDTSFEPAPGGKLRFTARLATGLRSCRVFCEVNTTGVAGTSQHLGLPPARFEVVELSDRCLVMDLEMPSSESRYDRVMKGLDSFQSATVRAVAMLLAGPLSASKESLFQAATSDPMPEIEVLGLTLAREINLTGLAETLFELLERRGWRRMALTLHADQRGPLVRGEPSVALSFTLPLATTVEVGQLELGGDGDSVQVMGLAPWIALAVEKASAVRDTVKRDLAREDIGSRIEGMARKFALTPRQAEVLGWMVQGLTNKEIATRLACAENTVELHVTQIFKKTGVKGRLQLVSQFWSPH